MQNTIKIASLDASYNTTIRILLFSLFATMSATVLFALIFASVRVSASVDTPVSITVPAACTMTGTGASSHTATLTPGTYSAASGSAYENGIGATTLTTFCNDAEGFSIYAIGYTNDTLGNTNLVGNTTGETIATKAYASGDTASNWSMKVNKVDDATSYMPVNMYIDGSFDDYHAVPSTYAKVAHFSASAGPSSTDATLGAKVTTTYASYASNTQVADTYTGQVKYIMVHPNAFVAGTYGITYNANGGSGTMAAEVAIPNYEEHTLATNTFTPPTDKIFKGWCTTNTSQTECTDGTFYAPEEIILPSTITGNTTLNLYAIWRDPYTIADAEYLQEVGACPGTLTTNQAYQIRDSRDGQYYHVAKLADGKCWMLDNLALDLTDSTILNSLSAANTHIDENNETAILTSLKNGNRDAGSQYATGGLTTDPSVNYSVPMANLNSKNIIPSDAISQAGNYKVGGYYNYCAATAGSYCYGNGTDEGTSIGDATNDICPKGWRLPTGDYGREFSNLAYAIYGSTGYSPDATAYADYRNALHLPLSGYFSNEVYNQGSNGYWWSSTRGDNNYMYVLSAQTNYLFPGGNTSYRNGAKNIRCIMDL